MINKIQIKRGSEQPGEGILDEGELGWDKKNKKLYVGNGNNRNATLINPPLDDKVPTSRKINNKPLNTDITLTYTDVGAAPASFGLGRQVTMATEQTLTNANDGVLNGWYKIDGNTTNGIGAIASMRVEAYSSVNVVQTAYQHNRSDYITIKQRYCLNGTWTAWSEITPRVFAPAGYGLGEESVLLTSDDDLNNIKTNGWYRWNYSSKPKNAPTTSGTAYMDIMRVWINTSNGCCYQEIIDVTDSAYRGTKVQRTIYGNTAYDWEWVNPPMAKDVEYRTTERLHDKVVYKKADSSKNIWYRLDGETTWYPYTSQVPSRYDFNNDSDGSVFNAAMDTLASSMLNGEARPIRFCDYPHLDGQTYVGTIYKHQSSYITITGASYNGEMVMKTKNGSWSGWSEMYSSRRKPTPADIGAGVMDMDILWTNTSPNVEFTEKTVSINLSNYQWVAIKYKLSHDKNYIKTVFGAIGDILNMEMITDSHYVGKRKATTSTSNIKFEAASYSASVPNKQEYIIPLEVYGIKI